MFLTEYASILWMHVRLHIISLLHGNEQQSSSQLFDRLYLLFL